MDAASDSVKSILITGATGTFGRAFLRRLQRDQLCERAVCYSRDEVKQAALRDEFDGWPRLFLGDVRDPVRLSMALRGVEVVVHAAALKRVDAGAYSPSEMVATNVQGTINVVNAAIQCSVSSVVIISSDKACSPTNIYGKTKSLAEDYAVHANSYGYPTGTRIAVVRYGNVLASRGSVVGIWRDQIARGIPMTVTDFRMTRFVMTIERAVDLVLYALRELRGGEVFVPLLPSARIADLALAVAPVVPQDMPTYPIRACGIRPGGEKLAERLLNEEEPGRTRFYDQHYIVAPSYHDWALAPAWPGLLVSPRLQYLSDGEDQRFLSATELRDLLASTEAGA